ncbi:MAG: beta-galactosidase [Clostridia bacterium]|nr:beta-galactosidase [Clostridia bacterium]
MANVIIPRPEHPNPLCVRKDWLNLNGEWEFEKDFGATGKERKLYEATSLSERITVPFCMESDLSGVGYKDFCACVWYRKDVEIPEAWLADGGKVLIHFGGCDYITVVYVNGKRIGRHVGGSVSFTMDITEGLTAGTNVITVRADDETRSGNQCGGKQSLKYHSHGCFYTRTTGIWQTVWLEHVPAAYIKTTRYLTDVAGSSLTVEVKGEAPDGTPVTAEAYWEGKKVGEACATTTFGFAVLTLKLSELHLWELGKGGLYDLKLTLGCDEVKSYFGMRSLGLDDSALVINGKKVFQRTVLDQGFYPDGIWTAPTEQALIDDITRSMACGFNGARLHQKVFEPLFLYHCDRLGYMVWDELGNWGIDFTKPNAWKAYTAEWTEIVTRDQNHPAIIGWCPFNETKMFQDHDLLATIADLTRRMDPTRPVIETSGWVHVPGGKATDIMDWHDYDQNPETFRQRYIDCANGVGVNNKKYSTELIVPRFISEYGGIKWDINSGLGNAWGYGNAPTTEEEFLERFKGLAEALMFNPFITGLCYTQLTDVEQEVNGLYTYDRRPKFDVSYFKAVLDQKAAIEE